MFDFIKNWLKLTEEQYYTNIRYLIIFDIANNGYTIPNDYFERIEEKLQLLERYKIREEKFEELKLIYKMRKMRIKLTTEDFYYGIPYTDTSFRGSRCISILIYRRDKKKVTSIPIGFLITEKELHLRKFNKKFDGVLKDE